MVLHQSQDKPHTTFLRMLGISFKINMPSVLSKASFRSLCDMAVCCVKQSFLLLPLKYTAFDRFTCYLLNRWSDI